MYVICVEASHKMGLGHLFRGMVLGRALIESGQSIWFCINDYLPAINLLKNQCLPYEVVPLDSSDSAWVDTMVDRSVPAVWIDDRLDTNADYGLRVQSKGIPRITFDDRGPGAAYADLHIAAFAFDENESLQGRRVLRGVDYLVLNPDVRLHRRLREGVERRLVTFGGTDTYGVTKKVIEVLHQLGCKATIVAGPGFSDESALVLAEQVGFSVKRSVTSMIAEFERHDLAITAGGLTPFEACATGLPCIVVATELHEVRNAYELERLGVALYAGWRDNFNPSQLVADLPVAAMSQRGIDRIDGLGVARVMEALLVL